MTKIEWTQDVWNPVVGCTIVDHRCTHCYAMRDAYRKQFHSNAKIRADYEGTVKLANGLPVWTGRVNLLEDRLEVPLRRRKPTTYFVDSMSDLFHANVPDGFIANVFATMSTTPEHRYIVLTKRHERMATLVGSFGFQERIERAGEWRGWCHANTDESNETAFKVVIAGSGAFTIRFDQAGWAR